MNILGRPSYFRSIKKLSASELSEANDAISRLPSALGKPHEHAGLGIRKLRPAVFEFRASLKTRILFALESGDLVLMFAGNHDEVRVWLRENC